MKIAFSKEMIEGQATKYPPTGEHFQTCIRIFDLLNLEYELKPNKFFNDFKDKHIDYHTTRYDKSLFSLNPSFNYNLVGRFDTYVYWYNNIKTEVEAWNYQPLLQTQATKRMDKIKTYFKNNNPTVSIHFRRGDYLLPKYSHAFCNLDNDYYIKAIKERRARRLNI